MVHFVLAGEFAIQILGLVPLAILEDVLFHNGIKPERVLKQLLPAQAVLVRDLPLKVVHLLLLHNVQRLLAQHGVLAVVVLTLMFVHLQEQARKQEPAPVLVADRYPNHVLVQELLMELPVGPLLVFVI
jgi:hypothetical protein